MNGNPWFALQRSCPGRKGQQQQQQQTLFPHLEITVDWRKDE